MHCAWGAQHLGHALRQEDTKLLGLFLLGLLPQACESPMAALGEPKSRYSAFRPETAL